MFYINVLHNILHEQQDTVSDWETYSSIGMNASWSVGFTDEWWQALRHKQV